MSEKAVIARKNYICHQCEGIIKKGDECVFGKTRHPKMEYAHPLDPSGRDKQIGVWYEHWRICRTCRPDPEKCPHEHLEYSYAYIPGECVQEPDYRYCVDYLEEDYPEAR